MGSETLYVTGLKVIAGGSDISPPAGWFRLPQDLNDGAGGEFIYLCLKRGTDKPIRGLFVISTNNEAVEAPAGFVKLGTDLNRGAGGRHLFLCYTKEPALGRPIREITFVSGGSTVAAPSGYTRVNQDLNEGAAGAYVYLCFKS